MSLNNRQAQILRTLSRSSDVLPIQQIADTYSVSVRTIYYDIDSINKLLDASNSGHVVVANRTVDGTAVDWSSVNTVASPLNHYSFSAEERRAMSLLRIALSCDRVSIATLMDVFEVSRNTVIADIRSIKEQVKDYRIELSSLQGSGYRLNGEERSVREVLWNEIQALQSVECRNALRAFLQQTLVQATREEIDFFELCRCLVKQYETDLDTRCFLGENGSELMMIQASWLRSLAGHWIEMGREEQAALMGTLSYRSIQCSSFKLAQSGLALPSPELLYITSLLLGIKTVSFSGQIDEDAYVNRLAERLATNFERVSCLNYVDKSIVCNQMSNHIRPLYYRLKYGLQADNPLANDIKKAYPMTFEFTRRAAEETGLYQLTDNEVGYLTIYLTAGLDRKMLEDGDTSSEKVLVVGAENNATVALLKRQITDACGIVLDYSIADIKDIRRWQLDRYALVLFLVPLPADMRCDNAIEVEPFLGDVELQRIFEVLRGNRIISRYNGMISEIVEIFKRTLPAGMGHQLESDRLFFELFRYFNKNDLGLVEKIPSVEEARRVIGGITSVHGGLTWQEAVLEGCQAICERTGSVSLRDRMGNLLQSTKLQWYRMDGDSVLVHCPMQGDSKGLVTTQVVLCSRGGVLFPDQRPASVIVCLTTVDRYSHWSALYTIYKSLPTYAVLNGMREGEFNRDNGIETPASPAIADEQDDSADFGMPSKASIQDEFGEGAR